MKLKTNVKKIDFKDVPSGHHKVPRVWIVVADKRIAKIFKNTPDGLECLFEALPDNIQRQKGEPDKYMGRVVSAGGARHKLEPRLEPGRCDAMAFAHDLSQWLEEAVQKSSFDRMILVAAPKTLGDLRQCLPKSVQARITHEIDKDLTKFDDQHLLEELKEFL